MPFLLLLLLLGATVLRTNSGESIFERCERKVGFQGAGLGVVTEDEEAMVRG